MLADALFRAGERPQARVAGAKPSARTALLVLGTAIIIRLAYVALVYHGGDSVRTPDSPLYEDYAQKLLDGCAGGATCDAAYMAERMPGYPLFLAAIRILAGPNLVWPVLVQVLIDAGSCVLVAWLAALFDRRLALPAGLLAAINLNMITTAGQILTDTLFLLPFTASLIATVLYLERPSMLRAFAAGLLLGLALLVRSTVMFFPPLLVGTLAIAAWRHRARPARAAAHVAIAAAATLLCIAPILARNVVTFGRFALVSQGGAHALGWVAPAAREFVLGIPFEEGQRQMRAELATELAAEQRQRLPDNPFGAADEMERVASRALRQLGISGLLQAWVAGAAINLGAPALVAVPPVAALDRPHFYETPGANAFDKVWAFGRRAAGSAFFWLMIPALAWMVVSRSLQLAGLFAIGRRGGLPLGPSLFLLAAALYFLAVTGPVTGVKYRLPLEPLLILLLAESGARIAARWRARSASRQGLPGYLDFHLPPKSAIVRAYGERTLPPCGEDTGMPVQGERSTIAEPPRLLAVAPRSWVGFAPKLIFTAAILALLARRVDWDAVLQRARSADRVFLLAAVAVLTLAIFVAAARWRQLMRRNGIAATPSWAVRANFTSLFIGQFLPGTVGADGAKLWLLWRAGHALRRAAASIVLDRITGLLGLLALIFASLPGLVGLAAPDMVRAVLAASVAVVGLLGLLLCVPVRLPSRLRGGRVEAAFHALDDARRSLWSGAAAFAVALSVLVHLTSVTAVVLIATSLGVALDFGHAAGIVGAAVLLSAVPLSVNGWGIREGAMVAGLSLVGIAQADALLISILFGLGAMVSTLPGAALWIFGAWMGDACR